MNVVELLRHAGAEPRDEWPDTDRQRPLDDLGTAQAQEIARQLASDPRPTVIVSSPAARCRQTVEPLAAALGVEVRVDERLAESSEAPVTDGGDAWVSAAWKGGRALSLIRELVAERPDSRAVVCSHGDVVPATVALLAGREGLAVHDVRCRKGGRFTLTFDGARCVSAHSVPPPRLASRRQER